VATPNPTTDRYMYFNVDHAFAHQLENGDVTIEVEYYDNTLSTVLGLQYDSSSAAYTNHPQPITTTGSNTWRVCDFEIADAFFGGRQNGGADFRFNFNGRKCNVNRVWVRLPEGRPIRSPGPMPLRSGARLVAKCQLAGRHRRPVRPHQHRAVFPRPEDARRNHCGV
jgi:hypothetical protein